MPKSLQDLVKGIRNAGYQNEVNYIMQALVDIHAECKSKKTSDKVEAIQKLTFLYLLGYDIRAYAFNTIECISSQDPVQKRVGYLASNFSFGSPDMQTLSTNLYINDIKNKSQQVKMMALSSLASCPAPNREQVHTLIPILYEQLQAQGQSLNNSSLLIKLIATTIRLLVLAKRKDIENTAEFVPDFVEILFNLASSGALTKDVVLTQVYSHCALETGRNFGHEYVMRLIPSLFDILITAKQPWILIEVCRFFGFMAIYDERIKQKTCEQFCMLLGATESKSLLMELSKATAEGFYDDHEMVVMATRRLSELIIPGPTRTDANLKTLAIKNLAVLEKATPGIVMRVEGLTNEVIQILEDKDFNLRIAVLDVISSLANPQYLENIVNKLLISLKQTKLMSKGQSIKDLHQVSASDIQVYKKKVVHVILDMCCRDNYTNITNTKWFIDVLITLSMEYPQLSADECAVRLLDLCLKADQLKPDAPRLVSIILDNKQFIDMAGITVFDKSSIPTISIQGPVVNQPFIDIQKEIEIFNKLLICKFGSNQVQTREIVDAINKQLQQTKLQPQQSVLKFFADRYFKIMEENQSTERKPFNQAKVMFTINSRIIQDDELHQFQSISNLMSTAAYILGTFFCYQPAGEDAINIYEALQMLLNKQIKSFSTDTALTYILSAFKAFVTIFYSYSANNIFSDENTASQFINENYFADFVTTKILTQEEVQEEKLKLEHERDARVANVDQTFMSDNEKSRLMFVPDVNDVKVLSLDSLLNIMIKSYDLLMSKIKEFSLQSELNHICNQLFYSGKQLASQLKELVQKVQTEHLKAELLNLIDKYIATEEDKQENNAVEPTLDNLATGFLTVSANDLSMEQKYVQRPEFAFENGSFFSLDNAEGCLTTEFDMFSYQMEEFTCQQYKERKRRRADHTSEAAPSTQSDSKQDLFQQFVTDTIEEPSIAAETKETSDLKTDEMASVFGAPTVKSAFYIDKNKLNKAETKIQIGKYTSNLRIGAQPANSSNAFGFKPTVTVQKPAEEGKRRRRHREQNDGAQEPPQQEQHHEIEALNEQQAQQHIEEVIAQEPPEVADIEETPAEPAAEPAVQQEQKPVDDLASLFM